MNGNESRVIIKGVHLELTEGLKSLVSGKVERLFRHEHTIVRLRIDLIQEPDADPALPFCAKGQIAIHGPDLVAEANAVNIGAAVDEVVQKLDRMLRRRARLSKVKRNHPHGTEISESLPKVAVA